MSRFRLPRPSATIRLAFGLIGLAISLVLVCDMVLGIFPDATDAQRHLRRRVAESLSTQVAVLVQAGEQKLLDTTLKDVVVRNHDVRSIALRRDDGSLVLARGDHARYWEVSDDKRSTLDHVQVPLLTGGRRWGSVEIAFAPLQQTRWQWVSQPAVVLPLSLATIGLLLFYAYLRRALQYLDPTSAVPDRVRKAFDTLSAALLVLDTRGRVMLANRAFRKLHPSADVTLHGREVSALDWLQPPATGSDAAVEAPWTRALRDGSPLTGIPLEIAQPTGKAIRTVVGCSPIVDAAGGVRGCLVTFDDVTAVHQANDELRLAMEELEQSRAQVEARNAELHQLATRDPLTGCFNRRAFFERGEVLMTEALHGQRALCVIMCDIDHFKQFNDRHGHAVGDLVIQAVAKTLAHGLRTADVLCRYGGEEFCLLLPDTPVVQGNTIAQRLRVAIMETAAASTRMSDVTSITSSFGLASTAQGFTSLATLIDAADGALYRSKRAGRNRVTLWEPPAAAAAAGAQAADLQLTS
jgi:diguanylate cyclase (GGDEF)-like protein/PAS domain S-box-containing protein